MTWLLLFASTAFAGETVAPLRVDLVGPGDRVQLVVRGQHDGWHVDHTRSPDCVIRIEPADLATLDDPMRNLVDHYLQRVDSSKH